MENSSVNLESNELDSVLSSIRRKVEKETRDRVSKRGKTERRSVTPKTRKTRAKSNSKNRVRSGNQSAATQKLPAKILVLRPHMRVDKKVKPKAPVSMNDSLAIATPSIDDELLRDMVREVVQEQLRGELGQQLISTLKKEMVRSLNKY